MQSILASDAGPTKQRKLDHLVPHHSPEPNVKLVTLPCFLAAKPDNEILMMVVAPPPQNAVMALMACSTLGLAGEVSCRGKVR